MFHRGMVLGTLLLMCCAQKPVRVGAHGTHTDDYVAGAEEGDEPKPKCKTAPSDEHASALMSEAERVTAIEGAVRTILGAIGEDVGREGLRDTPTRVAKAMLANTRGYDSRGSSLTKLVNGALFNESHHEIVIVRDITVYSMCEHHMLPFFGKAHVGYVPNGTVIGLSKLARITNHFARRLQVQERLTGQIATAMEETTHPLGVMVMIEATHMCMAMRGVEQTSASTTTTASRGVFSNDAALRNQFLQMLAR